MALNVETYRRYLLDNGATPEGAERIIAEQLRQEAHVDNMICPGCGGKLTRRLDPRQAGPVIVDGGRWHNYRCPCGFAVDRHEVVN